jgi:hypothetical protein
VKHSTEAEYEAAATELEATVQRVCAEVLAAAQLSVTADFFAAGGTSLQVFRVTSALQEALGIAFVAPTVIHVARNARKIAAGSAEPPTHGVWGGQGQ